MNFILVLISTALTLVWYLLLVQVILSWLIVLGVRHDTVARLNYYVASLTAPILAPIRRVLPRTGNFDFSVLAAFLLLMLIRQAISSAI